MDVHCSTCGEPWDVYHLRHDAIFETDLSHEEAEAWRTLSAKLRLSARYREEFYIITEAYRSATTVLLPEDY